MGTRLQAWWAAWLADARRFAWGTRAAAIALVGLWAVQAHRLGWTQPILGAVGSESAWGERNYYAGRGWASLQHLSVANVGRSVLVLPVLLLLGAALFWPRRVHQQGLAARCVLILALAALGLYSVIVPDVPFNFYGSRYFLPVVVPLAMLAFGVVLAPVRPAFAIPAVLGVIAAAGYYTAGLLVNPPYQGNLIAVQQAIAEHAGHGDMTILVGHRPQRGEWSLQTDLQPSLIGRNAGRVVFIDTERLRTGDELQQLIERYMQALHAEQATLVSERYLPFADQVDFLEERTSVMPFEIRYDTRKRQPVSHRIYVASYHDQSTVLGYSHPEWIVGGAMSLPLAGGTAGARDLRIRTAGGWLWAMGLANQAPRMQVRIDGADARLLAQSGNDFVFAIPAGATKPQRLEIQTSTFVPVDVGISPDRRRLGADLLSVRFEGPGASAN